MAAMSGSRKLWTAVILLVGSFLLCRGVLSLFSPSYTYPRNFSPWNVPNGTAPRRPQSSFRGPPRSNLHLPTGKPKRLADIYASAQSLIDDPDFAPVTCPLSLAHLARYRPLLQSKQTVLIVASYSNSDNVLLSVLRELPSIVSYLGPSRTHVAISEGGSTDHTPQLLHHLAQALTAVGGSYSILSTGASQKTAWDQDSERIKVLAEARNGPLGQLEAEAAADLGGFDVVVVMNDVVYCAADVLELVYQRVVQGADMVCALDYSRWVWVEGRPLGFYDTWVSRDIGGRAFYDIRPSGNFYDNSLDRMGGLLTRNPPDRRRLYDLLPFQVFSCWNGMLAISSAPLLPPHRIRLRPLPTQQQSEAFVLSQDMWQAGYGKIAVVPRVRVGYSKSDYEAVGLVNATEGLEPFEADHLAQQERISNWITKPPAQVEYYDSHSFWTPAMRSWDWLPEGA